MNTAGDTMEVVVYATRYCSYCTRARRLLEAKGVAYREIPVDTDIQARREMERRSGRRTVPQIFVGDRHVGGYEALVDFDTAGELDRLLLALPDGIMRMTPA
jgi:glutaredoxin 3